MRISLLHLPSRDPAEPPVAYRIEITAKPNELLDMKMAALELQQSTSRGVKVFGYMLQDCFEENHAT